MDIHVAEKTSEKAGSSLPSFYRMALPALIHSDLKHRPGIGSCWPSSSCPSEQAPYPVAGYSGPSEVKGPFLTTWHVALPLLLLFHVKLEGHSK
jgi:hypothetical protein